MVGELRHRRVAHNVQRRRQRAASLGLHHHVGVLEVGDVGLDVVEAPARMTLHPRRATAHAHAGALEDQLTRERFQRRPARLPRRLQALGHILHLHPAHRPRDAEGAALARQVEGQLVQLALHAHRHVAAIALADGVAHVLAGLDRQAERQVAVHARGVGAAEGALQVQHTRQARAAAVLGLAGVPAALEAAGGVRIGQLHVIDLHLDALALHAPLELGRQLRQGNARLLEHAGKLQRALAQRHAGAPAGWPRLQLQRHALQPRHARRHMAVRLGSARLRGHAQAGGGGLHPPAGGGHQGAAPAGVHALDEARGAQLLGALAHVGGQGQARGDAAQGRQIQAVAQQRAAMGAVTELKVAAWPGAAVGVGELQALRAQLKAAIQRAPHQTGAQLGQGQRRQIRRQRGRGVAHRHVGRGFDGHAMPDLGPHAQRRAAGHGAHAPALAGFEQLRPGRGLGARHAGVKLTVPALPAPGVQGQQRLTKAPDQREALAPCLLGRGVQPQLMAPQAIAQHPVHLLPLRRRPLGVGFVQPVHARAAHRNFLLREHPVHGAGVGGLVARHVDAADQQAPLRRAPQRQLGCIDHQLLQPAAQQRGHREHHQRVRHLQRGLTVGAQHAHVLHGNGRQQGIGLHRQCANGHGGPQRLAGPGRQARTEIVDSRHNEPVQHGPAGHGGQQQGRHREHGPAHHDGKNADQGRTQERLINRLPGHVGRPAGNAARLADGREGNYDPRRKSHPQSALAARCFAFPLQGGIASDRGDPGHGDRWLGLLRGRSARWVSSAAGGAQRHGSLT